MVLKKFSEIRVRHQVFFGLLGLAGVVAVWRGLWGLMDQYVFPNSLTLSYLISIVIGITIIGVAHYVIKEVL